VQDIFLKKLLKNISFQVHQMELQTLLEMEDIAVTEFEYHVVSSVPDFQTKLADSRPARLAVICRFKSGGGER
jgi:hypothetical protein